MPAEILASKVICQDCGHAFDFLPSHLRVHNKTSDEYRKGLQTNQTQPLYSQEYAKKMRELVTLRPDQLARLRHLPTTWNEGYKNTLLSLASAGYYVPSQASRLTGIPSTTLYTDIHTGKIPFAEASLLVHITEGDGKVRILHSRQPVKLIQEQDLTEYVRGHTLITF